MEAQLDVIFELGGTRSLGKFEVFVKRSRRAEVPGKSKPAQTRGQPRGGGQAGGLRGGVSKAAPDLRYITQNIGQTSLSIKP